MKAAVATISFMPIIMKSAAVMFTVLVILGLVAAIGSYVFVKAFKVKEVEQDKQKVTFDDVIVSDEIKEKLRMICNDISQEKKAMLEKVGFEPPRGYLLYGPPGNGKTLLARAVANEANLPFFSISGADIVSSFVNRGVHNIRKLFQTARKKAPCVVFIDEIDSIGSERYGSHKGEPLRAVSEEHNKTLNQLLSEMDGFDSNEGVIVIAATNRRKVLDEALLRPGRFSEHIYIPLPELSLRKKILDLYMKNVPAASDLNLKEIAEKTEGYSGAELSNLVNEAKHNAVKHAQEQKIEEPTVSMNDFTKALEKLKSEFQKSENEEASNIDDNVTSRLAQLFLETLQQYSAESAGV